MPLSDVGHSCADVPRGYGVVVVIACHNHAAFLEEAVASVARQTRQPEELVIIDDGSTDAIEGALAAALQLWPELVLIRHDQPLGPARSRSEGLARSTGHFAVFLDADDRLSGRYVELTERALIDGGADIAYTGLKLFGARETDVLPPPVLDRHGLRRHNRWHNAAMFRRSIVDAIGGLPTRMDAVGLEDWDFWLSALEAGATAVPVSGCWLEYRQHQASRNRLSLRRRYLVRRKLQALHPATIDKCDVAFGLKGDVRIVAATYLRTLLRKRTVRSLLAARSVRGRADD